MNVADSRRLAESLERYGMTAAQGPHDADVVVLYSCVVRQGAEDRVDERMNHHIGVHKHKDFPSRMLRPDVPGRSRPAWTGTIEDRCSPASSKCDRIIRRSVIHDNDFIHLPEYALQALRQVFLLIFYNHAK